jgi:hypothetical protein
MSRLLVIRLALAALALVLLFVIYRLRPKKALGALTVQELIDLYELPGGDDDAGPEFRRRGAVTRDELFRILDAIPVAALDRKQVHTIVRILQYEFPSEESRKALANLRSRTTVRRFQVELLWAMTHVGAKLNGHLDAWLEKQRGQHGPGYFEILLSAATPEDRILLLPMAARSALGAGDDPNAEAHARELLAIPELGTKSGDGAYYANHVLGMLALKAGDTAGAKRYMLQSAETPGSWELNEGGPDTSLAEALLARGEREAVLEYLDGCKRFWSGGRDVVERWQATIRSGGIPNFRRDRQEAPPPPQASPGGD